MSHSNICWGKVIKGAMVAAGAVAVVAYCPGFTAAVGTGIKEALVSTFGGIGTVGEWIAAHTATLAQWIAQHPATSVLTGATAGASAVIATSRNRAEQPEPPRSFAEESFVIREDMRRMQARMQAQLQAAGYNVNPAGQSR